MGFFESIRKILAGEEHKDDTVVVPAEATPVQEQPEQREDDGELIAVLMAAIYAFESEEGNLSPGTLRIKRFKRVESHTAWVTSPQ